MRTPIRLSSHTLVATLAVLALNCGKSSPKAAFSRAIQQQLGAQGDLCIGFERWPVDVRPDDTAALEQLSALEKAGVLVGADETVKSDVQRGNVRIRRYRLTPQGRQSFKGSAEDRGDVCYGQKKLVQVEKWEGPLSIGQFEQAKVVYTYRLEGLPAWTSSLQVKSAFPVLARNVGSGGQGSTEVLLTRTSEGWEAKTSRLLERERDFRPGTPPQQVMTRLP